MATSAADLRGVGPNPHPPHRQKGGWEGNSRCCGGGETLNSKPQNPTGKKAAGKAAAGGAAAGGGGPQALRTVGEWTELDGGEGRVYYYNNATQARTHPQPLYPFTRI